MQVLVNGELRELAGEEQAAWEAERAALAVPRQVTRTQALLALLALPAPITEAQILVAIDAIADVVERERARILFMHPTWQRGDAFIALLGAGFGFDPPAIDAIFMAAAQI